MAGRPPKVDHVREAFLGQTNSARSLVKSVVTLSGINPNTACPRLHVEHSRRVVELAFLGLVSAWEEFLEQVFVRYMCAARADSGYIPNLRMGRASDLGHAYQVLSGDPKYNPARHYSRFSDPKWVISSAKLYFDQGSPFSPRMQSRIEILQNAVKLRNRVAHLSQKVRTEFIASAKLHLGKQCDKPLPQGFRVGDLLLIPPNRLFNQKIQNKQPDYFMAYCATFRSLAECIVPK